MYINLIIVNVLLLSRRAEDLITQQQQQQKKNPLIYIHSRFTAFASFEFAIQIFHRFSSFFYT
jgi:hypothetical protein